MSRTFYGARISLLVGLASVALGASLGVLLGISAGYWGGTVDKLVMRLIDAMMSIPSIFFALAIVAALGPSLFNIILAIGFTTLPSFARLVRGQVLKLREQEFIQAARAMGARDTRIMFRHALPNVVAPIIVEGSLRLAQAIISEASLSFLGVGIPPPTPSWGLLVRDGYNFMEMAPWLVLFPGLFLFVTVLSFNFLGDALRDALDPTMRRGE